MKWPLSRNRRLLLGRATQSHDRAPLPASGDYKFDIHSGLMYTEGTISSQRLEELDWARPRYITTKSTLANPRPAKGSRTLRCTAVGVAVENLMDLDFDGISRLPRGAIIAIWELANERYYVPLSVWKIFSNVLREEDDIPLNVLRFSEYVGAPRLGLQTYTAPLISPTFEFLTYLNITVNFSVPELVRLASVKNLGILEVVHNFRGKHQSSVTDRLIRAWHQATIDDGAFPVLRILKLWNHKEVTEVSLRYLNSFPALALFDVRGCTFNTGSRAIGRTLGWKSTLDVGVLSFFDAMCVERVVLMRATIDEKPKPIRRAASRQLTDHDKVIRIPRSEVAGFLTNSRLPTPRPGLELHPEWTVWEKDGNFIERPSTSSSSEKIRRNIHDNRSHIAQLYETWEFIPYTIFSRIGELRSDRDLRRAGVSVSDAGVVNEQLVSTVPMACLHLGRQNEPLNPLLPNNPIKSFYGNAYTESSSSASRYRSENTKTLDRPGEEMFQFPNYMPRGRPDPRNITFYRIKTPSSDSEANTSGVVEVVDNEANKGEKRNSMKSKRSASPFARFRDEGQTANKEISMSPRRSASPFTMFKEKGKKADKEGSMTPERAHSPITVPVFKDQVEQLPEPTKSRRSSLAYFGKHPAKFMQNKKQKLNDVLSSFM
ncbi:uncharacterized protein RSE6_02492 [Rhynchosporium secalis]|uniref:Uncharacterized protein n=1 Tax=Rhynchosporium secalis TaxID=38038 RepID=A0A1E1M0C5_RHYSE|nr:uncharacterized protein RSE6_02492 [Rhynchosporium secalis]